MIRVFMVAALLAVIIPFGLFTRSVVAGFSQRGIDFASGVVVGLVLCYAFWLWDERIRQREGSRSRSD